MPVLYRRRFFPDEIVKLKDDVIIYSKDDIIITRWTVLKPRTDFQKGVSWYFFNKGFKVSKFYKDTGELYYTYCDIIEHEHNQRDNSYIISDLLADVIIYNDGSVKVIDLGELTEALESGLIDIEQLKRAINRLDNLLQIIYCGGLEELIGGIDPNIDITMSGC